MNLVLNVFLCSSKSKQDSSKGASIELFFLYYLLIVGLVKHQTGEDCVSLG